MDIRLLLDNMTNPALLFFVLGLLAVQAKSDLAVPENSSKFISIYLLFSIGFNGGQELSHSALELETLWIVLSGIAMSVLIPVYSFFIVKRRLGIQNAGALAAAYGSISAVTFVTCVSYLEMKGISFGGYMIAVMALMEAPAIVVGVLLMSYFRKEKEKGVQLSKLVWHSLTNGSVFLIIGSLVIGFLASEEQAKGIAPFTTDIFKGFLAIFLLDMGIESGKKLNTFKKNGYFPVAFSIFVPLLNGLVVTVISGFLTSSVGDRLLLTILAASASYIAVPAAMKMAAPKANPGLYIPMALAITFPFNITIGIPLYLFIIQSF